MLPLSLASASVLDLGVVVAVVVPVKQTNTLNRERQASREQKARKYCNEKHYTMNKHPVGTVPSWTNGNGMNESIGNAEVQKSTAAKQPPCVSSGIGGPFSAKVSLRQVVTKQQKPTWLFSNTRASPLPATFKRAKWSKSRWSWASSARRNDEKKKETRHKKKTLPRPGWVIDRPPQNPRDDETTPEFPFPLLL
jgi:hypothetical protein